MVSYEEIAKANESLSSIDVKGKEYVQVNQRIKAFRMVYPTGFIETYMMQNSEGVCVFRAECGFYEEDTRIILGTGTAYEKESSSFINKTSFIENCETSAIGRALGVCGFGIDTSVASAEEVENAINNQKVNYEKIGEQRVEQILDYINEGLLDLPKMLEHYKVSKIEDLTVEQGKEVCETAEKKKSKK